MRENKALIKEAIARGYRSGTIIDYEAQLEGTDTLGSGEFAFKNGDLIKYECELDKDISQDRRRFDTIWSKKDGWTKIVKEKHGLAL
jgi:hypothetical protein